jgi:DNA-nicking Smr family endonuclease
MVGERRTMTRRKRQERDNTQGSLEDQLRTIGQQLRKTKKKREPERKTEMEKPAATEPEPTDAQMFEQAVAGAREIKARNAHVRSSATAHRESKSLGANENANPAADEHFDVRFSDLYIRGRAAGVSRETVDRLARGEFAVRSHVDLHGMAFDDARGAVDEFLVEKHKRGERCVLVITGKGKNSPGQKAVLRERIPEWIARGPSSRRVLAFVTARPCDGGEGALYVLLRKTVASKGHIDVEAGGGT